MIPFELVFRLFSSQILLQPFLFPYNPVRFSPFLLRCFHTPPSLPPPPVCMRKRWKKIGESHKTDMAAARPPRPCATHYTLLVLLLLIYCYLSIRMPVTYARASLPFALASNTASTSPVHRKRHTNTLFINISTVLIAFSCVMFRFTFACPVLPDG